jgi:hypothetical protein
LLVREKSDVAATLVSLPRKADNWLAFECNIVDDFFCQVCYGATTRKDSGREKQPRRPLAAGRGLKKYQKQGVK